MKKNNKISMLQGAKHLPTLPQVLLQLIETCEDEDMQLSDLSKIIVKDPSISSKILGLVNSSYLGLRTTFTSIDKAVVYLGADTIKSVSIAASVHQVFNKLQNTEQFSLSRFWWNSFSSATYAKRIAMEISYANPEKAYLTALLHDLGELLLWMNFPKEYKEVALSETDSGTQCQKEETYIGINHCEAGAWLAGQWKLNSFIVDTISYHHSPPDQIQNALPLVKLVYLADKCRQANNDDYKSVYSIGRKLLDLTQNQIDTILEGVEEEVGEVAESLGIQAKASKKGKQEESHQNKSDLDLQTQVKNYSLLSGFLENLIQAESRNDLFKATEEAFSILFNIETMFFFLHAFEDAKLYGCSSNENPFNSMAQELILSVEKGANLLTESLLSKQLITTLHSDRPHLKSIADAQLYDALGSNGMLYIPMIAKTKPMGIIVLGLQEGLSEELSNPSTLKLLHLVANQAALSFYLDEVKSKQAQQIEAARVEGAAMAAAKVVHEANNPLGIIKNYLKILEMKTGTTTPVNEELTILGEEIDRVSALLKQLDNFSTPPAHTLKLAEINSLISDLLSILKKSVFYSTQLQIHFSQGSDLPKILVNTDAIKQILINLIKNAAEAIGKGGNVTISTSVSKHSPGPEAGNKQNMLQITIEDDGPGIPEELVSQLFTPFTSTKGKGHSGLGLSIIHALVTKMKGFITCSTSKNGGALFTIILPVPQNN